MLTSSVAVCTQLEGHSCCIAGEAYTFRVQQGALSRDGRPVAEDHTVLQIEVFRGNDGARVARMRITVPTQAIDGVPTLLTRTLEHWLAAAAPSTGGQPARRTGR